jgi:7-cyano-7-deazaguanine synthase in queuosine biosynthesis
VKTLVVCSGGLDSVTLAHKVAVDQTVIHLVSFDYGQRHRRELEYARRCATRLGVTHDIVDITDIGRRLTGSALTDGEAASRSTTAAFVGRSAMATLELSAYNVASDSLPASARSEPNWPLLHCPQSSTTILDIMSVSESSTALMVP